MLNEAEGKDMFEAGDLLPGDQNRIKQFVNKFIVPNEELVNEYLEHLAYLKMKKDKRNKIH